MRRIFAFSLLAPALMAQAPATPDVQTLAQKVAAETKVIETLKADDPVAALEKSKALLPATKLPFDKASLQTAYASIREWKAQIAIYRLIYNNGIAAGHFEEAKEAVEKARDLATELQKEAMASFNAYKATWLKAGEDSTKALAEIKELEAKVEANRIAKLANPKPKVTMEEANQDLMVQHQISERLTFLKGNEATYKQNIENASKAMAPLEGPIKDLESRTHDFDVPIAQWEKHLKDESEEITAKYKGDKAIYASALLRAVTPKPEKKDAALVSLRRAAFLDPSNPGVQKRIDQLLGKAPTPPEKPAKGKAKAKKGK